MSDVAMPIAGHRIADPIAMEVFSNRLLAIADETANSMIRASFSSNIKERKDCSVALFAIDGRLIAQASHIPLHLGSLMGSVRAVLARYPADKMKPGDVFICNDPYVAGGTHTPDISVVTPVFHNSRPLYFAANVGHHSDVGGTVPGSTHGGATSIFEEGLRLPVMKLFHEGVLDEDLLSMISLSSRLPEERGLDIKVQAAANDRGARLMLELVASLGEEQVAQSVDDLLAYTSARLHNRIVDMSDGAASFTSIIESDGIDDEPIVIQANVTVTGSKLIVNFDGTGRQARGALNVPESALHASVFYVVKALLDPNLLPNSGMFTNISISAPEGSLLNPRAPAAVGARSITCNRVVRALIGAFTQLLPAEKAMASGQDIVPGVVFAGRRRGRTGGYVYVEAIGGGAGARFDMDGMDGIHVHVTNSSNLPIEPLETEYDLLVEEYALVNGSGGAGEHRGGMGIAREILVRSGDVVFSARSDGHREGAPGAAGGASGRPAHLILKSADGKQTELSPMVSRLALSAGDSIRMETPGGGGFGQPQKRRSEALARDLRDGRLTVVESELYYGPEKTTQALQS